MSRAADELLVRAAERGDCGMFDRALRRGANIHAFDEYALCASAFYGHIPILKYLVLAGADVHAQDDEALVSAVAGDQEEAIDLLLKAGSNYYRVHLNSLTTKIRHVFERHFNRTHFRAPGRLAYS